MVRKNSVYIGQCFCTEEQRKAELRDRKIQICTWCYHPKKTFKLIDQAAKQPHYLLFSHAGEARPRSQKIRTRKLIKTMLVIIYYIYISKKFDDLKSVIGDVERTKRINVI